MAYTQKQRMARVMSPLGEDALLVQRMVAREAMSQLFDVQLELLSEVDDLDFTAIVGKPICVAIQLADRSERFVHGIVSRFSQGISQGRFVSYRAQLVPWFWLLTRRQSCRIFQHLSVPDIVKKIFGELGMPDFKLELSGSYAPREYCVQYRESDFNFISRLLEEEGIGYFFQHEEKAHTLVLFDSADAHAPCPGQESALYASGTGEGGNLGDVRGLCFERELRPGGYALTDFNFEQPSLSLLTSTASTDCVGSSPRFEVYDYPGNFLEPGEGDRCVKLRMEAEECASVRVTAESDVAAFTPGYRFDLQGHYQRSRNQAYTITEVTHMLTDCAGDEQTGESSYTNTLACMPHSVPFRPPRRATRPAIHGVQTATVVGAPGKEIDVDPHARVIVQFHWDREGKRDQNSSCRVRVAQNWAGKGWGLIAHPRIGQEVIVEFLEGDPDRPIITGRVYNAEQIVPYTLPANATQSGLKSRSSPGGGATNFNEIRFEDKKGDEHVYIQAEKNRTTLTKNDDVQTVNHDRTRTVKNDEKITVEKNQTIDVKVDRTRTVGGNEQISITGNEKITIMGDLTQSVTGKQEESAQTITLSAMVGLELRCGASVIKMNPGMITIQAPIVKIN